MYQHPSYGVHDSLEAERFINDLAATPLLTLDEEHTLTRAIVRLKQEKALALEQCIDGHDWQTRVALTEHIDRLSRDRQNAIDRLFAANFRLVLEFANKTRRMEFMDQVQWGCIGLLRAIEKFDPYFIDTNNGRTIKFSTYATYWIVQFIQRGSDQQESLIRFPVHARDILKRLARKHAEYLQTHDHAPSFEQLCTYAGFPKEVIPKIRRIAMVAEIPYSIQAPFLSSFGTQSVASQSGRSISLADMLYDESANTEYGYLAFERIQEIRDRVQCALEALETYVDPRLGITPYLRHARVLRLRFRVGEEYTFGEEPCRTLEEVGRLMIDEKSPHGITRERTRQLQRVAVEWLKKHQPDLVNLLRED